MGPVKEPIDVSTAVLAGLRREGVAGPTRLGVQKRRNTMKNQTILAVLALSVSFVAMQSPAQTPAYHALLLGLSDGRTNIQVEHPAGLNRWGQVIGNYGGGLSGGVHAVLWTPNSANDGFNAGTLYSLELSQGFPTGTAWTWPTGMNDRGQIAGTAYTPGQGDGNQQQSWMWRPGPLNAKNGSVLNRGKGKAVAFPLLGIPGLGALAEDFQVINNKGVIGASGINGRALLWTPSTPNALTGAWTFDPDHGNGPAAINDAGQITGSSCLNSVWNGPYLHAGAMPMLDTDVLTSPLWEPRTNQECVGGASGMNSKGDLAISAVSSTVRAIHAYLYKNGAATDLTPGVLSGGLAAAIAINNYDQVVGHVDSDLRRASLLQNGQVLDLNTLNDFGNGLFLRDVIAINDRGQILCSGSFPGAGASILLTPNALVINPVVVTKGTMQISGQTYSQTVTVQNLGTTTIAGPVSVALDGLTSGVTLTNQTGTTVYTGPGSAYADVSPSDLQAGATTAAFTLVFSNPKLKTITYSARVLGSAAPR
jgi:hypothetical protein